MDLPKAAGPPRKTSKSALPWNAPRGTSDSCRWAGCVSQCPLRHRVCSSLLGPDRRPDGSGSYAALRARSAERRPNRLERIFRLMESCDASIHDLSRITLSGPQDVPRFNMPFELGMAYALAQKVSHDFFVLEEKPFRLQASLSDLNGHDPHIHDSTPSGALRCVLN